MSSDFLPPELTTGTEGRKREQNETPITQEKMVNNLLLHLDTHNSMEPDKILPKELGARVTAQKPLSVI